MIEFSVAGNFRECDKQVSEADLRQYLEKQNMMEKAEENSEKKTIEEMFRNIKEYKDWTFKRERDAIKMSTRQRKVKFQSFSFFQFFFCLTM